jgi:hypothetical protein
MIRDWGFLFLIPGHLDLQIIETFNFRSKKIHLGNIYRMTLIWIALLLMRRIYNGCRAL